MQIISSTRRTLRHQQRFKHINNTDLRIATVILIRIQTQRKVIKRKKKKYVELFNGKSSSCLLL